MAKLTRAFNRGVMDKDLDPRLVQSGTIRNAVNVNVSSSEGSEVGGVENTLGNENKSSIGFDADTAMTIGSIAVEETGCIYWFVNTDSNEDYVYEYNQNSGVTTMVLGDSNGVLNFNREYRITGVNYIDGLLYWTDDLNPPRRVNIQRAKSYGMNGFTEVDINVIVAPPLHAPTVELSYDTEIPNNLVDKFVYFSYRYKYLDGEYSSLSPFSNAAFAPSAFYINGSTGVNAGMENLYNKATITYEKGGDNVTDIQLLYRDSESTNVYLVETIKKEEATGKFEFTNNKKYGVLSSDQVTRLFDNVPLKAQAQDIVGTRLVYGNYVQFFDMNTATGEDVNVDMTVEVKSEDVTAPGASVKSNRDYEVGVVYMDEYGRSTPAQTCETNTIYVKPSADTTKNTLRVKINHEAPAFASDYRFVVKESKGSYENIFVNYFIEDSGFNFFLVNKSDVNKAKIGEYVVLKNNEQKTLGTENRLKIVDVVTLEKDELGSGLPAFTGPYIKIVSDPTFSVSDLEGTLDSIFGSALSKQFSTKTWDGVFTDTNGTNNRTTQVAFVENPIYYPKKNGNKSGEGVVSISRNHSIITSPRRDLRYNIVITDVDSSGAKFNYYTWPTTPRLSTRGGGNMIENSDISISATASTEYGIKDENGNVIFYIKFSNNNSMAIGDRYVVNVRSSSGLNLHGMGGFDTGERALAFCPVGAVMGAIQGGAIITIAASSDQIQHNTKQVFTANKDYVNFEEWYYEDRIYKRLQTTIVGGVSSDSFNTGVKGGSLITIDTPGCESIFFSRGIVSATRLKQERDADAQSAYGDIVLCYISSYNYNYKQSVEGKKSNPVYLQVNLSATTSQLAIETLPSQTIDGIFREIPGTYSITDGRHSGSVQDQYFNSGPFLGQPAITDLQFENCYVFGNGVESIAIRDDFNGIKVTQSPRVTAEVEEYRQERVSNGLTYSGVYREDSNVNKLNQFNLSLANFKYLNKNFGSIQKLHGRDTDLIVFQENKVSKVLFEKNLLSDAAGGGSIASIPQVLGTQIAFGGEYGISESPESFATWGNMMYWADPRRNAVLRMGVDGTQPISAYGMTDYFRDSFISTGGKMKLGGYDPYNNTYVLSSNTQSVDACEISISRTVIKETKDEVRVKLLTVTSNRSWTISKVDTGDGTDWLTLGTTSGDGTQDVYGTFSENTSGSPRSMTIEVSGCSIDLTATVKQTASLEKTIRVYVVNSEEDFGNVASQTYSYTSSPGNGIRYIDTPLLEGGLALYASNTEKVGTNKMPLPGDTVTMTAYDEIVGINGGTASPFIPDLGNKCYYYVSNTSYTAQDYDAVIAAGTEVTMSLTGGNYVGSFAYSTPSDEQYLYLVWDYRNIKDCSQTQSYDGAAGYTPMDFEIGNDTGVVDVDYNLTAGDVIVNVIYNGSIVATTGSITGPVTGTLNFTKRHTTPTNVVVQVVNDSISSSGYGISVTTNCPTLEPILIDPTNGDSSNVCAQTASTTYYTDGASTGTDGARIYTDSNGTTPFNGGDSLHLIGTGNNYVLVDSDGYIRASNTCNCTASSEPTGTDAFVQVYDGDSVSLRLEADETPTSWAVSTLATRYSLSGGEYGAVFRGMDMRTALYKNVAVYTGVTREETFVDGTVTKIQGDSGSFTKIGPDSSYSLPDGLSLNEVTGVVSGTPTKLGSWKVDFVATNCIGTSAPFTVRFDVITTDAVETDVTPFSIDITNSDPASACGVTPSYDIMYHDGYYTYPVTGDKIYSSSLANSPFDGNDLWYLMNNGQTAQVDNTGVITAIVDCVQTVYTGDSFVYEANAVDTCAGTIYSYSLYYTGTLGVNPGKLYDDSALTTLSPAGWYKAQGSSAAAYEWNGSEWTGNAYVC
jgi:hypothetical protein